MCHVDIVLLRHCLIWGGEISIMNKYEYRIKKNKIIRRRNRIIVVLFTMMVFFWGFYMGNKLASQKNTLLSDSNKTSKEDKKLSAAQLKQAKEKEELKKRFTTSQSAGEYKPWEINKGSGKKIAYLTFDDGPSSNNTPEVLRILKEHNIKATFFLIGENAEEHKDLVEQEVKEGHIVANHTYSHSLKYYREDPALFIEDINKCDSVIKSIVGQEYNLKLLRFPGGSFSTPRLNMQPYKDAATTSGYHFVNWNDMTGDAEGGNLPVSTLMNNLRKYTTDNTVVIQMHDAAAKTTTVQALPEVIQYLQNNGYTFETLG